MPKYYCDYCDTYLTHDSPSVRKTHNSGKKHKDNVIAYYRQWMDQEIQKRVDSTVQVFNITRRTGAVPAPIMPMMPVLPGMAGMTNSPLPVPPMPGMGGVANFPGGMPFPPMGVPPPGPFPMPPGAGSLPPVPGSFPMPPPNMNQAGQIGVMHPGFIPHVPPNPQMNS